MLKSSTLRHVFLSTVMLGTATLWAQGPNRTGTYYESTNGKAGAALKTAFFHVISGSIHGSYDGLWAIYRTSDRRADGKLYDIYSNTTNYVIGSSAQGHPYSGEGDGYNREHTVPKSWFFEEKPMIYDAHHILPSDGYVNNRRSNFPYGETKGEKYQSNNGFSKLGRCTLPGYGGTVFEPNDEYKGDLARIYFYMVTCYESNVSNWSSANGGTNIFTGNAYKPFVKWQMDMLLRWAKKDPVSDKEIKRNEAVAKAQGNRNPFVDYPGLEDYIWGDSMNVAFSYDHYRTGGSVVVPDPTPDPTPQPGVDGVVFNESFASGKRMFTVDNKKLSNGMTNVWSSYANDKVQCMKASAYVKGANKAAESWLVSPVIDLTAYDKVQMSFEQACKYLKSYRNKGGEFLSVMIREVGQSTWTNLNVEIPGLENWTFVQTNPINLSAYAGKKIQVAFAYKSTTSCAPTWEIRNLKITGSVPTGISRVITDWNKLDPAAPMYDLSGQRVQENYKGVVIQHGRKHLKR